MLLETSASRALVVVAGSAVSSTGSSAALSRGSLEHVGAGAAVDDVIAGAAHLRVVTGDAPDHISAVRRGFAAAHQIMARARHDDIAAAEAADDVIAAQPAD